MQDYLLSMGITVILTAIRESVKNPKRAAELKKALLKVYWAIGALYANDPDFIHQ